MTKDKNIFILNIYFMLTYAFRELKQNNYEEIAGEDFDNIPLIPQHYNLTLFISS